MGPLCTLQTVQPSVVAVNDPNMGQKRHSNIPGMLPCQKSLLACPWHWLNSSLLYGRELIPMKEKRITQESTFYKECELDATSFNFIIHYINIHHINNLIAFNYCVFCHIINILGVKFCKLGLFLSSILPVKNWYFFKNSISHYVN